MTAIALVEQLRERGVRIELVPPDKLRCGPQSLLKPGDLDALREHKAEVCRLVAEEQATEAPPRCRRCRGRTVWVRDWPLAGTDDWRCTACEQSPEAFLRALFPLLPAEDQQCLVAEAEAGDTLAQLVLAEVRK